MRALEKKIQEDEKAAAKVDADRQAQADSIVGLESDLDGIIQAGNEADKEAQEAKGTYNVLNSKILQYRVNAQPWHPFVDVRQRSANSLCLTPPHYSHSTLHTPPTLHTPHSTLHLHSTLPTVA